MKAKYARKITQIDYIFICIAAVLFLGGIFLLVYDGWDRLFWVIYPLLYITMLFKGSIAQISERDILDAKGYFIDIHTIIAVEKEDEKGNIRITFPHFGDVRTISILIHDKDKDRFIADLLSVNPQIELKQQLCYNV
jgi:hypothetical protein